MLSRRQLLAASPTTLPLFLALSGCRRPAGLSGPPPLSRETVTLLHAVTAEQNLIWVYAKTGSVHPALAPTLAPLLAEHRQHLARLRARVVEPPGRHGPDTVTAKPAIAATRAGALGQLRTAEQAAITTLLGRLDGAAPSLAQLYASIAASESTHVAVLAREGAA